jgi:transcription elongation GreA/GreB family factor
LQDQQVLVSPPSDEKYVQIGHVISLEDEDGSVREFLVAGYGETDLRSDPPTLEYGAPIISPFMGTEVGTEADVQIKGKRTSLLLTAIKKGG